MILKLMNEFESDLMSYSPNPSISVDVQNNVVREALMHPHIFSKNGPLGEAPPMTMGIVFSGGPAPGGHDVLCGILSHLRPNDRLIGFCNGPGGLLKGQYKEIFKQDMQLIEGLGGFDFLGTDRTKISTKDQFSRVQEVVQSLGIRVLIVVGGDDSNTNALFLSDVLYGMCNVIGVPKTIDGDLVMDPYLPITFGFHTATQHYASLVQQLFIDAVATRKYWHVVKLMGRAASHVTLEVANQVCPNACLLSEEILQKKWGFIEVVDYFSTVIIDRLAAGKPYGVIIFPEGIVDVVPELNAYVDGNVDPINHVLASIGARPISLPEVSEDSHGNKNMSFLDTETIFIDAIYAYLNHQGSSDSSIQMLAHFFGYTGRSENPSSFDSLYSLLLGKTAYELALSNITGVIVGCEFSTKTVRPLGIPLLSMVTFDDKRERYVIQKQLVSHTSTNFQLYLKNKASWVQEDIGFPRKEVFEIPNRVHLDYLNEELIE